MAARSAPAMFVLAVMLMMAASARGQEAGAAPPKPKQQRFATCKEAMLNTPGYNFTVMALRNCPDLEALQSDTQAEMTYFVPSDKAVKSLASYIGMPVTAMASPNFKGIMCNVLRYHMVPGVHLKKDWQVGEAFTTRFNNAKITVSAVGQVPQVTTTTGVHANIKRVSFCGKSVAFGVDAVLTPFRVPRMPGHRGPAQSQAQ